jgi:hypothetical protein
MAKKPKVDKKKQPKKSGAGTLQPLLWIVFFSIILLVFPESIILFAIGILPTLVAFIIDKAPRKHSTICVCAMNIAGIFPLMLELWLGQNNIPQAIQIITNVYDLVIMYAAAGCGWLLYMIIPSIVDTLLGVMARHRISLLRTKQRTLLGEWGDEITSRPEPEIKEIDPETLTESSI